MSTFLVSLGVVGATIAVVVHVVLNGPDQPATIRRQASRAAKRRRQRGSRRARPGPKVDTDAVPASPAARGPTAILGGPAFALPESDVMRLRVMPARRTTLWVRIRSGVALVVLVAVLGALLAVAVGGLLVGVALLVRSATG